MHLSIQNLKFNSCRQSVNLPICRQPDDNSDRAGELSGISNICYKPFFTSKNELTFNDSKAEIVNRMRANYASEEIINEISDVLTPDNIQLGKVLLFDKRVNKRELDVPEILKSINPVNKDIAEIICLNPNIKGNLKPELISLITPETKELTARLLPEISPLHTINILEIASEKDDFQTAGAICSVFLYDGKDFPFEILKLFPNTAKYPDTANILKTIYQKEDLTGKNQRGYFENMSDFNFPVLKKLYEKNLPDNFITDILPDINKKREFLENNDLEELVERVEYQKTLVRKNPGKYINRTGYFSLNTSRYDDAVDILFNSRYASLMILASVFDKETMDVIFQKKENFVVQYTNKISKLSYTDFNMLKKLVKCSNASGKPFTPTQKIDFPDMIIALNSSQELRDLTNSMIQNNMVDLDILNKKIIGVAYDMAGLSQSEINKIPKSKHALWNLKYVHQLAAEFNRTNNPKALKDIVKAASLSNFIDYINNPLNIYGEANLRTQKKFELIGLNYDKWVNPKKQLEVQFLNKDDNANIIDIFASQTEEDIETLRQSNSTLKHIIDKQFQKYIVDDKFVIPEACHKNKCKLENLVKDVIVKLDKVWKQAEVNKNKANQTGNADLASKASSTLMICYHLVERYNTLEVFDDKSSSNDYNLTIKNWDRVPQHDLFQGNYSTCCISLGKGTNSKAMPDYLLNTAFNMIELKDNETGNIIGNALCYWVNTSDNNDPALVVDNIEINNFFKPSGKVGIKLRNAVIQYAKNLALYSSNGKYDRVILGKSFNDIPTGDLSAVSGRIGFIGDISCNDIYLDLYKGWVSKSRLYASDAKYFPVSER